MIKFREFGASSPEESQREKDNRALARKAAAEGIVLLKNDGVLPLAPCAIGLYGAGSCFTVKGGTGSGDVRERYSVSAEEGLKNAGFSFPNPAWIDRLKAKYQEDVAEWRDKVEQSIRWYGPLRTAKMFSEVRKYPKPEPVCLPLTPDDLTGETDTALYVISRQAGEGKDRRDCPGDYELSETEKENLKILSGRFKKLVLVVNSGSVVDLSIMDEVRIDAVLFIGQGGMEGGNALADVLTGKVCPSGRLTDTWARSYGDYPSSGTVGGNDGDPDNDDYAEGIYVGYRWFEKNGVAPRFPFGFGLSYTAFKKEVCAVDSEKVVVRVKNTGDFAGKEAVLVFISKPEGRFDHEKRALAAFAKTQILDPGGSQTLEIRFDLENIAVFDETRSVFCLELGQYAVYLENEVCGSFALDREIVFYPGRGAADGDLVNGGLSPVAGVAPAPENGGLSPVAPPVAESLSRLSAKEKCMLVTGGGYPVRAYNHVLGAAGHTCTKLLKKKGIPNIVLSDGPAGLNVLPDVGVSRGGFPLLPGGLPEEWRWGWLRRTEKLIIFLSRGGKRIFRFMTAWPCETVLAQTWDEKLLEEVGGAIGAEAKEIGVSVWLGPGLNIHRDPLCGRNFEYFSEDPVVSGKMAAALTRGVQSVGGVGASVKHFCCNNQEDNRTTVSANVGLRALREIYLRGFRIAVNEGRPWTVMSSYNRVNGLHVCNSKELVTGILRDEWGFDGLVMTDWWATNKCSVPESINAGNDLIMPGNQRVLRALKKALKGGALDREALDRAAGKVLELIFKGLYTEETEKLKAQRGTDPGFALASGASKDT
jgi:beta-glucosidase